MTSRMLQPERDVVRPAPARSISVSIDGEPVEGLEGQSVAGVLLGSGRLAWRTTAAGRRPRGAFCGIGVCYDCLITVNGLRDVRACQRIARDGDVLARQDERLPRTAETDGRPGA
jgi:predicted molibdopterin-dependent oxidoreductase YjgC